MKAIIIYHTRFGNTERIAKCLERGLKEAAGIQDVVCINVGDVIAADSLKDHLCLKPACRRKAAEDAAERRKCIH